MHLRRKSTVNCAAAAVLALLSQGTVRGQGNALDIDRGAIDVATQERTGLMVPDLMVRSRVTAITPAKPVVIHYRYGGEGLGGNKGDGAFGADLDVGEWSPAVPVVSLYKGRPTEYPQRFFITVSAGEGGRPVRGRPDHSNLMSGGSTGAEFEFEFSWRGKVLKTIKEPAPDGGTAGLFIPAYRLADNRNPDDPAFLSELNGLLAYANQRADRLGASPFAKGPFPNLYPIVTDCQGYGNGIYYGIRYANRKVFDAECRTLRLLGVNGLASPYPFFVEAMTQPGSIASEFRRMMYLQLCGYVLPGADAPDVGCPSGPSVPGLIAANLTNALARSIGLPVDEVWWRTEDEIGGITDRTAEGKHHLCICPRCAEAFRRYLQQQGLTPRDFGKQKWAEIAPANIWGEGRGAAAKAPPAVNGRVVDRYTGLTAWYTHRFHIVRSATMFTQVRDALRQLNAEKDKALATGDTDSAAAKRPYLYSFALRGCTFLTGGHSLDFFDFYRYADNAMVYETSDRDNRMLGWDSHLCDVGRMLGETENILFGIYIKPHRGGPIQRMLSAVSRDARMLYWYVYGPEYVKGDNFLFSPETVQQTHQAAALLGRTEDTLYKSAWMVPAEVAVVSPRTSESWWRLADETNSHAYVAAFENAKWVYSALQHAHVPVDPLDEGMLETRDLTRYKLIYINGIHLTRRAARNVAAWVHAGGTLYTSGIGLVRDEASQPLTELDPVLGLARRQVPEMWYKVKAYGSGKPEPFDDARFAIAPVPATAAIAGAGLFKGSCMPRIGREVLSPAKDTEVLATYADGAAAITRHPHGKGSAIVAGFFPGLEYSAKVRGDDWNMANDFDPVLRSFVTAPALALTRPVVDASNPLVEGVLLQSTRNGKRAVTLANFSFRTVRENPGAAATVCLNALKDVTIAIRRAGPLTKVRSAWLERDLPVTVRGDVVHVSVPELGNGDVLLIE